MQIREETTFNWLLGFFRWRFSPLICNLLVTLFHSRCGTIGGAINGQSMISLLRILLSNRFIGNTRWMIMIS